MQGSLALTAMRNEGPFILEWVAWQKMLGFENILIMHNDCTDHTPQLLRLLDRVGRGGRRVSDQQLRWIDL